MVLVLVLVLVPLRLLLLLLASFWDQSGIILGSIWHHSLTNLVSFLDQSGFFVIDLAPFCHQSGITFGFESIWHHSGINLASF